MSRFARVTSIDALQTTASALQKFKAEAAVAMDDLDAEVRRGLEWIQHERKDFWSQELRRRSEQMAEARLHLQQARAARQFEGREPDCIDEQRALACAKRRVETAEEKGQAVRHWSRAVEQAVEEYQRSRNLFLSWLDIDLPKAVAALNRMSDTLDTYVSLQTPGDAHAPVAAPTEESQAKDDQPEQAGP